MPQLVKSDVVEAKIRGRRMLSLAKIWGSSEQNHDYLRSRRGLAPERPREFAPDSPLEGDGFELPVPQHKSREFPQHSGRRLLF